MERACIFHFPIFSFGISLRMHSNGTSFIDSCDSIECCTFVCCYWLKTRWKRLKAAGNYLRLNYGNLIYEYSLIFFKLSLFSIEFSSQFGNSSSNRLGIKKICTLFALLSVFRSIFAVFSFAPQIHIRINIFGPIYKIRLKCSSLGWVESILFQQIEMYNCDFISIHSLFLSTFAQ